MAVAVVLSNPHCLADLVQPDGFVDVEELIMRPAIEFRFSR